ncbi:hypothetical protein [Mucilaginibacter gossypii]|uniref:Uncharacterized protein n=1 Tax=Mucilaginibacter gossypii TaxID=551996 RepID=A0A1G7XJ69_9SPHI|nr:hypothetical protein [Mucilaginibacter gossypii]SDG84275.1 hypothetical protein SAMN05192573_10581 [Mucilaginibacter gossypii]
MAKEKKKAEPKPRAEKYEGKVSFDGTLEQMIKMAGNTKLPPKKEDK